MNIHAIKNELRRRAEKEGLGRWSEPPFEQLVLDSLEQHEKTIILQRKKLDIAKDLLKGAGGSYMEFYRMLVKKRL